MSDLPRVILLTLTEAESVYLANCLSVGGAVISRDVSVTRYIMNKIADSGNPDTHNAIMTRLHGLTMHAWPDHGEELIVPDSDEGAAMLAMLEAQRKSAGL